jgi:uncharacterized repeat protein (TIGR01451 family)
MQASTLAKYLAGAVALMAMAGPACSFAQTATAPAQAQAPAQAPAASPVTLKGDVMLEKTVTENGVSTVQLSEPKVVIPGDRLLFTTRYHNEGAQPVTNFVVTNPLPSAVALAADGATGNEVSVDGGKTWGELASLKVAGSEGAPRAATAADVTHIRWTIAKIAPGASGEVQYHGIVR